MIPAAIVFMMIGSLVGGIVVGIFGNQLAMDTASAFLGMFAFVFSAGLIAPIKQRGTTLVFLIIISVIALIQIGASIITNFELIDDITPARQVFIPIAQLTGALISKLIFNRIIKKDSEADNQMGSIRENVTIGFVGILFLVMEILGVLIHLFTVLMANEVDGFISAAVAFIFPVVAELFWFVRVWMITGSFLNPYSIGILAYVVVFVLLGVMLNESEKRT